MARAQDSIYTCRFEWGGGVPGLPLAWKPLAVLAFAPFAIAQGQGVWERRASFPMEAAGVSAATVFGQKLYAVCGITAKGAVSSLFIYDPAVDEWTSGAPLPVEGGARDCNVAASAGKLYVLGALRGGGPSIDGNTYIYDTIENQWIIAGKMPTPRVASGVAVVGTKIYVAGGLDAGGNSLSAFEVFDTNNRRWTRLPNMPTARSHLTAKAIKGLVYAIAGRAGDVLNTTEEYTPSTRSWRARAPIPSARYRLASGKSNGRIQVFGGEGPCATAGAACAQNEQYDPSANVWRSLLPMPTPRHSLYGVTMEGRVFLAGGMRAGTTLSNAHDAFYLPLATPPVIADGGILNAASLDPGISPGSLVSLFGEQFSQGEQRSLRSPLPSQMNAVTVRLNGKTVPLMYVSPSQINFQIPQDFPLGPVELSVTNAGLESARVSLPNLARYSPGIFTFGQSGDGQGAIFIAGTGQVAGSRKAPGFRPARKGDVVEIYCTGLGPVTPPGGATVSRPVVTIGDAPAEILISGLAQGLEGVYQVTARIPAAAPAGMAVHVNMRVGPPDVPGSNQVTMAILDSR